MYLLSFVLFVLYAHTDASCPDIPTAESIDYTGLAGIWHDVAITSNDFQFGDVFASTNYNIDGDVITMTASNNHQHDRDYVEGRAKHLPNGKILCTYVVGNPKVTVEALMSILSLDENFLTLYACFYDPDQDDYHEVVWVSTKMAKLEADVKDRIQSYINNFKPPPSMKKITWNTNF